MSRHMHVKLYVSQVEVPIYMNSTIKYRERVKESQTFEIAAHKTK